jgi:hypothetical protein
MNKGIPFTKKFIWKLKIPLKDKIFLWFIQQGVILTKDNLAQKNWVGSQKCCFYDRNEMIKLFFIVILQKLSGGLSILLPG